MFDRLKGIFQASKDNKTTTLMGLAALVLAGLNLYWPDSGFDKLMPVAIASGLVAAADGKKSN